MISARQPTKVMQKVYSIRYGSTGGFWKGLDNRFRDHFVARFKGNLRIPLNGKYTFYTTSDDGSKLYINGVAVVNNDGTHGMRTRHGTKNMKKGAATVVVDFFERTGGAGLKVDWAGPGFRRRPLDGSYIKPIHEEMTQLMLSKGELSDEIMEQEKSEETKLGEVRDATKAAAQRKDSDSSALGVEKLSHIDLAIAQLVKTATQM